MTTDLANSEFYLLLPHNPDSFGKQLQAQRNLEIGVWEIQLT
jgi:hypothetical protein